MEISRSGKVDPTRPGLLKLQKPQGEMPECPLLLTQITGALAKERVRAQNMESMLPLYVNGVVAGSGSECSCPRPSTPVTGCRFRPEARALGDLAAVAALLGCGTSDGVVAPRRLTYSS